MKKVFKPLDFSQVSTYSLKSRKSKVNITDHFSGEITAGLTLRDFTSRLPPLLGAKNLQSVADLLLQHERKRSQ